MSKKKLLFMLLIFIVIFVSACNTPITPTPINNNQSQVTCNKPYILDRDACCLDVNNNNICDKSESEAHISSEVTTASNDIIQITCPKEVRFSTTENPNIEVTLNFNATYTGFGNDNFKTAFSCDDSYVGTVSPITVTLEKSVSQILKTKVTLSPRTCTFRLFENSIDGKSISCDIPVHTV